MELAMDERVAARSAPHSELLDRLKEQLAEVVARADELDTEDWLDPPKWVREMGRKRATLQIDVAQAGRLIAVANMARAVRTNLESGLGYTYMPPSVWHGFVAALDALDELKNGTTARTTPTD